MHGRAHTRGVAQGVGKLLVKRQPGRCAAGGLFIRRELYVAVGRHGDVPGITATELVCGGCARHDHRVRFIKFTTAVALPCHGVASEACKNL